MVATRQNRVINVLREMGSGGAMVTASGMRAKGDVLIKRVSIAISNLALQNEL